MNSITKVTVQRAEGPNTSDFSLHTFEGETAEAAANSFLREIAQTAPKTGGYDKCDLTVTLVSGDTIGLRHDVKHTSLPDNDTDVRQHLRDFLFYHLNPEQIPHVARMPKARREQAVAQLKRMHAEDVPEFTRLLNVLVGVR